MARVVLRDEYTDKWTEQTQEQIEKTLSEVYNKAWKEVQKKEQIFIKKFEEKDKIKREQYKNGEITKQEYQTWRINQTGIDERWKALQDSLAKKASEANKIASDYVNSKTPEIFATNHNFEGYQIEKNTGISFNIIDKNTVKNLAEGVNATEFQVNNGDGTYTFRRLQTNQVKDYNWNYDKMQKTLMSGIVQGKSAQDIGKDFYQVMGSNKKSAIRNARTAITSAQNSGRFAGRNQLAEKMSKYGMHIKQQWVSAHDGRVRDSHASIDGEIVELDETFSNGLRFPGDPWGPPSEVYNCRCTTITVIDGINDNDYVNSSDYSEFHQWLDAKHAGKINWSYEVAKQYSTNEKKELDSTLKKSTTAVWKALTNEQKKDLHGYTSSDYILENTYLRNVGYNITAYESYNIQEKIQNITNAINKSSFPQTMIVTRNIGYSSTNKFLGISDDLLRYGSEADLKSELIGKEVIEFGFMSTTGYMKANVDDVQFQIKIPKRSKAMYMQPFSATTYTVEDSKYIWDGEKEYSTNDGEFEILIQRNSAFVITDIKIEGEKKIIQMLLKGVE